MRRAVLVAAVVVVAGCGGSARLSKAEYGRHVRAVGAELKHATANFSVAAGDLRALARATATAQKALAHGADELDALTPPKEAARDNDELVSGLRAVAREMAKVHRAAATGNRKLAQQAATEIGSSPEIKTATDAIRDLKRKGYDVGAFG
jgi:dihydrodipicolinate synthase/N-acetylneuraminate lyase